MIPPIASRFVAGETMEEAVARARELEDRGVGALLNLLGEHYGDPAEAASDTAAYLELLEELPGRSCVSVKPSQLGLDVAEERFRENLARIVAHAAEHDRFVWIDMEDHTTTDATLAAYEELAPEYPWTVGVCVQANLRRTRGDVERLSSLPGKVRLVKGAYDPPESVAYKGRERVNRAYEELLEVAFREFDEGVGVGSHDPRMIERAVALGEEHGTGFEIQMLMGVREDAQYELAREHDVYQYVPYGGKWLSYFYRRVAERKENLLFALRAVLGR